MVNEADLEAGLEADDERLGDLAAQISEAGSGTAFMLEKQYDQRLAELKRQRRDQRIETLEDRLGDLAREVHKQDTDTGPSVLEGNESADDETYTLAQLTLLANEGRETDVGNVLDDVAADPGVTVRFTGPWPPYTFSPDLGNETTDGTRTNATE